MSEQRSANSAFKSDKKALYYSRRNHAWQAEEPPAGDAKYMIVAEARSTYLVANDFYAAAKGGGWQQLSVKDQATLNGYLRGLSFTSRPRQNSTGQTFVELTSVRYVDDQLADELLDGLDLYDAKTLEKLDMPTLALDRFCLTGDDVRVFYERVGREQGAVIPLQGDAQAIPRAYGRVNDIHTEMLALCEASRRIINAIADGNNTDAPVVSENNDRGRALHYEARERIEFIRDERLALNNGSVSLEVKAQAESYQVAGEQYLNEIEKMLRELEGLEAQAVRRIGEPMAASLKAAETPAVHLRFMLTPVVEYYQERGVEVRHGPKGPVFLLADGTAVEMSDTIRVLTPDGSSSVGGEKALGQQAERGRRAL